MIGGSAWCNQALKQCARYKEEPDVPRLLFVRGVVPSEAVCDSVDVRVHADTNGPMTTFCQLLQAHQE